MKTLVEIERFARITRNAMGQMLRAVPLMEAIDALEAPRRAEDEQAESQRSLARFKDDVAFVEERRADRFSAIYAQAIVAAWGAVESHVDDVLISYVSTDKSVLARDGLQKIRVTLAQFEALTAAERIEYLIDAVKRDLNARFKAGIGQFEAVLNAFDIGGGVDEEMRRVFLEFAQVRNLIVHRRGMADKRLADACPWLGVSVGSPIQVDETMVSRYVAHAALYAALIQERLERRYGQVPESLLLTISRLRDVAVG